MNPQQTPNPAYQSNHWPTPQKRPKGYVCVTENLGREHETEVMNTPRVSPGESNVVLCEVTPAPHPQGRQAVVSQLRPLLAGSLLFRHREPRDNQHQRARLHHLRITVRISVIQRTRVHVCFGVRGQRSASRRNMRVATMVGTLTTLSLTTTTT